LKRKKEKRKKKERTGTCPLRSTLPMNKRKKEEGKGGPVRPRSGGEMVNGLKGETTEKKERRKSRRKTSRIRNPRGRGGEERTHLHLIPNSSRVGRKLFRGGKKRREEKGKRRKGPTSFYPIEKRGKKTPVFSGRLHVSCKQENRTRGKKGRKEKRRDMLSRHQLAVEEREGRKRRGYLSAGNRSVDREGGRKESGALTQLRQRKEKKKAVTFILIRRRRELRKEGEEGEKKGKVATLNSIIPFAKEGKRVATIICAVTIITTGEEKKKDLFPRRGGKREGEP